MLVFVLARVWDLLCTVWDVESVSNIVRNASKQRLYLLFCHQARSRASSPWLGKGQGAILFTADRSLLHVQHVVIYIYPLPLDKAMFPARVKRIIIIIIGL